MAEEQRQLDVSLHPDLGLVDERCRGYLLQAARQRLKHAIFNSLDECIAAIESYIEHHNANDARPFRWSKKPEDLVEAWKKGHQKLKESAS